MWERIKLIRSGVWNFLRPMIRVFLSEAGPILAKAAINAVTAAAGMTTATGPEKRQAANSIMRQELYSQGITLGESIINLAIEAAVQKLKSSDAR